MEKRVEKFAAIRAALSFPLTTIQYAVSQPIQFIDTLKTALSSHKKLQQENSQLRTEQLLLKTKLQRLIAVESENNYLKALFQSSQKIKSKSLIAEVMAVSSEPFIHQLVLNKGGRDGVYVGQSVLDANGVMGQVTQIGPHTSRVLLINDSSSGVAVQSGRNGMRAVAIGDTYDSRMKLKFVPHTADVKAGDIFITSGLGGRYPAGYPVGVVSLVDRDASHQFATVYLEPSAQLSSSRQVLLIWHRTNA